MFPVIHDAALFANGGNGTIVETRWENHRLGGDKSTN